MKWPNCHSEWWREAKDPNADSEQAEGKIKLFIKENVTESAAKL